MFTFDLVVRLLASILYSTPFIVSLVVPVAASRNGSVICILFDAGSCVLSPDEPSMKLPLISTRFPVR